MKKRLLTFRMDPSDIDWLDKYAVTLGVDRTAVVSDLIRALRAGRLRFVPPEEPEAFPASIRSRGLDLSWASCIERAEMESKFKGFCVPDADTGCWNWKDATSKPFFYWRGKSYPAARFSLAFYGGPIPDGMFACHTCDNQLCVCPDHLWAGTPLENTRDMWSKGRNFGGSNWTPQPARPVPELTRRAPLPDTPTQPIETLFVGSHEAASLAFPAEHPPNAAPNNLKE